jgi:hypothetical protein
MLIVPLKKVTMPVGTPAPGAVAVTAAVKVTGWPVDDGLADEVMVVVVAALLTVWVNAALVLPVKLASPA